MSTDGITAKEAAHILMQAEEIKKDVTLMKGVADVMKDKKKDVKKILSIKELRQVASDKTRELQEETDEAPEEEKEESKDSKYASEPDTSGGQVAAGYDDEKEKALASSLGKKMAKVN